MWWGGWVACRGVVVEGGSAWFKEKEKTNEEGSAFVVCVCESDQELASINSQASDCDVVLPSWWFRGREETEAQGSLKI